MEHKQRDGSTVKELEERIKKVYKVGGMEELDRMDWNHISGYEVLSEEFIRKYQGKVNWRAISEDQVLSEDFIGRWADRVNWCVISENQVLSEEFIEEHQNKVDWYYISENQVLSEDFIGRWAEKVDWYSISKYQALSEAFIERWGSRVKWEFITKYQRLSEGFIERWADKIIMEHIFYYQVLSEAFIERWGSKVKDCFIEEQLKSHHDSRTNGEKREEVELYAKRNELEYKDGWLYAYRRHTKRDSGIWNSSTRYEVGRKYRDWRCDLNKRREDSFGLGIWPEGNTLVRVHYKDWGVLSDWDSGKARVWGFEVIRKVS